MPPFFKDVGESALAKQIVRALGGQWFGGYGMARCPAHDDHDPSLSIRQRNGRVVFHCFADCPPAKIKAVLRSHGLWRVGHYEPGEARLMTRRAGRKETAADELRRVQHALKIWKETEPAAGTLVQRYLQSRRINASPPEVLRFHPALKHWPTGQVYPAMIALVTDGRSGDPIGIHRTYLSLDGMAKAQVRPNKMMLGRAGGGAVRLRSGDAPLLIGEGIETSLSAMQATGNSTWAALSTSGVRALDLPDAVQEVVLIPDGDDAGMGAAQQAAIRWARQGRVVKVAPAPRNSDFNDLLSGRREGRHDNS
jgi:putative DNA primase/helicase